ncbi:MAG: histone deacetylase [Dehalococcoidia bacterium]|nr:histone deacetylase [Dehalococcoidia bacterium]
MSVGLVYDPIYLGHDTGDHIENGRRLERILEVLGNSGIRQQLVGIAPDPAPLEDLLLVHSAQHVARVDRYSAEGGGWLDGDTVTSPESYEAAIYAVGGTAKAVDKVIRGEIESAFALVRPPGHHATRTEAMGFCLFNNVAIAAKLALQKHGLERVLIVDFDVHHGNGTQDIFYDEPRVLYLSTHQWPLYPGTGRVEDTGVAGGRGYTVNIPLPPWCGDREYLLSFEKIVVPVARRYRPQIILASAGYDAHWADNISSMQVTVGGYARIAAILKQLAAELCQGRLVLALEGGYHLQALAHSVKATIEVLMGLPAGVDDPLGSPPHGSSAVDVTALMQRIKAVHDL